MTFKELETVAQRISAALSDYSIATICEQTGLGEQRASSLRRNPQTATLAELHMLDTAGLIAVNVTAGFRK